MQAKKKLDPVKTREDILAAATRLFSRDGFAGTSIGQVAKEANVPKSLVQYHFGTKEQLWDAVTESRMARMIDAMRKVANGEGSFLEFMRARFDHFASNPDSGRLMSWVCLQMPELPKPVRENAENIRNVVEAQGPDIFVPLLILCAMDGWHQNRHLYARVMGPSLMEPKLQDQFRDALFRTYERLSADAKFKETIAQAIQGESE